MVKSQLTTSVYDFGTKKSNPRNQKICCLTPHHTAGLASPLTYAKQHRDGSQQASANYYIKDDEILCGVSEDRRAWTSGDPSGKQKGGASNDHRAITFEVSNSTGAPNWKISDKSYKSLVKLCADICKRYGFIPKYDGTKNGTITMHKQFGATACPGPYLENLIVSHKFEQDILAEMGAGFSTPVEDPKPVQEKVLYRVQVGAFKNKANAESLSATLLQKGYNNFIKKEGEFFKVQVGAYAVKKNAEAMLDKLAKAGHKGFITVGGTT